MTPARARLPLALLVDDDLGVAEAVAGGLVERGWQPVLLGVRAGTPTGPTRVPVDLADGPALERAVASASGSTGKVLSRRANIVRKESPRPKITDGRKIVTFSP